MGFILKWKEGAVPTQTNPPAGQVGGSALPACEASTLSHMGTPTHLCGPHGLSVTRLLMARRPSLMWLSSLWGDWLLLFQKSVLYSISDLPGAGPTLSVCPFAFLTLVSPVKRISLMPENPDFTSSTHSCCSLRGFNVHVRCDNKIWV